jgi:hypothetical protein
MLPNKSSHAAVKFIRPAMPNRSILSPTFCLTPAFAQDANLRKLGGFKNTGTPMMEPIPQTGEVWQVGIVGTLLIFVLLADRFSQSWR